MPNKNSNDVETLLIPKKAHKRHHDVDYPVSVSFLVAVNRVKVYFR